MKTLQHFFLGAICLCLWAMAAQAQAPNWSFLSSGGNQTLSGLSQAVAVVNDAAANSYVAGQRGDTLAVQKFSAAGQLQWTATVQQKSMLNKMYDLAIDASGNLYIVGSFRDSCRFGTTQLVAVPGSNFTNAGFLAKLSPTGDFLWAIKGNPSGRFESVAVDAQGQVLVGGYVGNNQALEIGGLTVPATAPRKHLFVAKVDATGAAVWGKVFQTAFGSAPAGADGAVHDLTVDGSGQLYFTGVFNGGAGVDFGGTNLSSSSPELFVAKTDASGNLLWVKQSVSAPGKETTGQAIGVDASGKVYVAGTIEGNVSFGSFTANFQGTTGVNTLVLLQYSATGDVLAVKAFGKIKDVVATVKNLGMALHPQGDAYLAAHAGNFVTDGIDFGDGVSASFPVNGRIVNYVVKVNAAGVTQWAKLNRENMGDEFFNLSIDAAENVYVCGRWLEGLGYDQLSAPSAPAGILLAKLGSQSSSSLAEKAKDALGWELFPNPNNGWFTLTSERDAQFELLDLQGRVLHRFQLTAPQQSFYEMLPPACYWLRETNSGSMRKMLVQ